MSIVIVVNQKKSFVYKVTNILFRKILCVQKWSYDNYMILNPGKCYYMTFGSNTAKHDFFLDDGTVVLSREVRVAFGKRLYKNYVKRLQIN